MLYSPLLQELIKCLGGIREPIICFDDLGDPQHREGLHQVFLSILGLSPVWAEAKTAPEKVSAETCTYFNLPNWDICVTLVCQTSQLLSPLGLISEPKDGTAYF